MDTLSEPYILYSLMSGPSCHSIVISHHAMCDLPVATHGSLRTTALEPVHGAVASAIEVTKYSAWSAPPHPFPRAHQSKTSHIRNIGLSDASEIPDLKCSWLRRDLQTQTFNKTYPQQLHGLPAQKAKRHLMSSALDIASEDVGAPLYPSVSNAAGRPEAGAHNRAAAAASPLFSPSYRTGFERGSPHAVLKTLL